jgi:hypothetical protein
MAIHRASSAAIFGGLIDGISGKNIILNMCVQTTSSMAKELP